MAFDLSRVLRSLLFASPGAISVKEIQAVFTRFHEEASTVASSSAPADGGEDSEDAAGRAVVAPSEVPSLVTASQIREAMDAIGAQLEASNEVFRLQETHQGWRLVTSPESAEWVRLFRNQPKPIKLSQSVMETLAIIAYRQPVVRSEIESIRGVSADSAINRLLERDLIQIVGRADLPGRPIQYGTTDSFLEFIGSKSIDELPASDVLSAREIDSWLKRHEKQHPVADQELGLDTESGDETADLEIKDKTAPAKRANGSDASPGHNAGQAAPDEQHASEPAGESVNFDESATGTTP